jgi:methylamine---glutamate N-methyltransferase subunit A
MCGIAGLLYKSPLDGGPLGRDMLKMLDVLRSRGADSTGVALYGGEVDRADAWVAWINLNSRGDSEALAGRVAEEAGRFGAVASAARTGSLLRLTFSGDREIDVDGLTRAIEALPGAEVFGVGRSMELVKDMGTAEVLAERHAMADFRGTHGLGHTRLATESIVDVAHSHPYWARPFRDIAVVHNGQLTNHHKLRRQFEARGFHFLTDNDSEVIAVYIASQLEAGATLQTALEGSVRDLDGTFTYLISTADGIGFAKDRYASKPLIVAETPDFVALASEEVALVPVLPAGADVWEPEARTVRTWSR